MSYFCNYKCRIFARLAMTIKNTLKAKISYRITRNKSSVFVRKDFADLGGYDQIGRVLKQLVNSDFIISLGYGVYARTKKSSISGNIIPEKPLQDLAKEALQKLGINIAPSKAEQSYNQGSSTQVPVGRVIGIKGRVNRKIGYKGKYVSFEKVA